MFNSNILKTGKENHPYKVVFYLPTSTERIQFASILLKNYLRGSIAKLFLAGVFEGFHVWMFTELFMNFVA